MQIEATEKRLNKKNNLDQEQCNEPTKATIFFFSFLHKTCMSKHGNLREKIEAENFIALINISNSYISFHPSAALTKHSNQTVFQFLLYVL